MIHQNPQLRPLVERALQCLAEDPFHSALRTHKLAGDLAGIWSCSIDYSYRILFEFINDPDDDAEDAILLLNLGSHDEVY